MTYFQRLRLALRLACPGRVQPISFQAVADAMTDSEGNRRQIDAAQMREALKVFLKFTDARLRSDPRAFVTFVRHIADLHRGN